MYILINFNNYSIHNMIVHIYIILSKLIFKNNLSALNQWTDYFQWLNNYKFPLKLFTELIGINSSITSEVICTHVLRHCFCLKSHANNL